MFLSCLIHRHYLKNTVLMEIASALRWPDYLILASFLVISLGIGLYHALTGGRQKTTSEFIMANRSLKILPTSISLLVSYQSAIMILGLAAEMYWFGAQLLLLSTCSFMLTTLITVVIFVPWMFPLKLTSVYEVRRYKTIFWPSFCRFLNFHIITIRVVQ